MIDIIEIFGELHFFLKKWKIEHKSELFNEFHPKYSLIDDKVIKFIFEAILFPFNVYLSNFNYLNIITLLFLFISHIFILIIQFILYNLLQQLII
jgi:hypothetical protein